MLAASRNFAQHFSPGIRFRDIPSQMFVWIGGLLLAFFLVKDLLTRYSSKFRELDYKRRVSTACYAVQLLVTSVGLVILVHYGSGALSYDRPQYHEVATRRIQEWGEDLDWTVSLDWIADAVGYGMLPVLAWYMVELCLLGAVGCASIWVVLHHVLTVVLVLYIMAPAMQCVDFGFFRMGWILMMHALLEQPQFLALLLHRLNAVPRLDLVFAASSIYSFIHRLGLLAASFWVYANICWLRPVFNNWVMFHRWFLPPTIVFLFVMQLYPVHVYMALYRQHAARRAWRLKNSKLWSGNAGAESHGGAGDGKPSTTEVDQSASSYDPAASGTAAELNQTESTAAIISNGAVAAQEQGAVPSDGQGFEFMPAGSSMRIYMLSSRLFLMACRHCVFFRCNWSSAWVITCATCSCAHPATHHAKSRG